MTSKWNFVNDNSKANYGVGNENNYGAEVLKSNLCEYNDSYILVRVDIIIRAAGVAHVMFKNCTPFTKYISQKMMGQQ